MVTGAAGFIGSHFVDYVLENHPEDQVIGFDCLTYAGNMKNLKLAIPNKRFEFVNGDIRNSDQVDAVVAKVDAIVNFAAETHVDRSIASSSEFISTNVLGVNVLLESTLKNKIPIFHQISTDEVYGSIATGSSLEEDRLMPRSPYAASKAAADLLVEAFQVTHNINTKITRACNNFGPRQYPEKLIPYFLSLVKQNLELPVYGNGRNVREWVYVKDHVRSIDLILRHRNSNFRVYNLPSQLALENIVLVRKIIQLTDYSEGKLKFVSDRKGHDFRYSMATERFHQDFHFSFRDSFDVNLENTIRSYEVV